MKPTFYRDGDKFILATGECPPEFKDVLYVVWEGDIDNLKEGVRTADQLKQLEKVDEVDADWRDAFTAACGLSFEAAPDRELPKATKAKRRKPRPARRDTSMDEFVAHCATGIDPVTAAVASGIFDRTKPGSKCVAGTDSDSYRNFHCVVVVLCMLASLPLFYFILKCQ